MIVISVSVERWIFHHRSMKAFLQPFTDKKYCLTWMNIPLNVQSKFDVICSNSLRVNNVRFCCNSRGQHYQVETSFSEHNFWKVYCHYTSQSPSIYLRVFLKRHSITFTFSCWWILQFCTELASKKLTLGARNIPTVLRLFHDAYSRTILK